MKKTILTAIGMCCAASVFAQGTVSFNNRNVATTHVYGTTGTTRITGNAANDLPAGSTLYPGNTLIGTAGGQFTAAGTWTSFLGATGNLLDDSTMQAGNLGTTLGGGFATSFRTGTAASGIAGAPTATFNNIPKDYNPPSTFEMVAWDNSSGLYSTWALAKTAWNAGLIAAGKSDLFQYTVGIGGDSNTSPLWNNSNVKSFNIYFAQVPEPTTMALAGLASAAMLIMRRRK